MDWKTLSRLRCFVPTESRKVKWQWLVPSLLLAATLTVRYFQLVQSPVHLGGLFGVASEEVLAHGGSLPSRLPHYTAGGIPFAYPPLSFYVAAGLMVLFNISYESLAIWLPGIYAVVTPVPLFFLARELTGSDRIAGVACVIFIASSVVQTSVFSGATIVYTTALLAAVTGVYSALRYFKDHSKVAFGIALSGWIIVLASHPTKSAWVALSYIFLWAWYDRSLKGLYSGAVIAAIGFIITAPWWGTVIARHGPEVFLQASMTHGGLFPLKFEFTYWDQMLSSYWLQMAGILGVFVLVITRRAGVIVWYIFTVAAIPIVGFSSLISVIAGTGIVYGAIALTSVSVYLYGKVCEIYQCSRQITVRRNTVTTVIILLLMVVVAIGASANIEKTTANQPIETSDKVGMQWVSEHTPPESRFILAGSQEYDWFPLYANRTVVANPFGAEWTDGGQARQKRMRDKLLSCPDLECVSIVSDSRHLGVTHIYISAGHNASSWMESANSSSTWRVAYSNESVVVLEHI